MCFLPEREVQKTWFYLWLNLRESPTLLPSSLPPWQAVQFIHQAPDSPLVPGHGHPPPGACVTTKLLRAGTLMIPLASFYLIIEKTDAKMQLYLWIFCHAVRIIFLFVWSFYKFILNTKFLNVVFIPWIHSKSFTKEERERELWHVMESDWWEHRALQDIYFQKGFPRRNLSWQDCKVYTPSQKFWTVKSRCLYFAFEKYSIQSIKTTAFFS